jgi:hypothetical protein
MPNKNFVPIIVKFCEAINIIPDFSIVGMKNVSAIFVYIYAFNIFRKDITTQMQPSLQNEAPEASISHFPGKNRTK